MNNLQLHESHKYNGMKEDRKKVYHMIPFAFGSNKVKISL